MDGKLKFLMAALCTFLFFGHVPSAPAEPPILGSPQAKKGGVFRYNLPVAPATLNPLTAHDNYSITVLPWMAESMLARHEETYEWVPILAEKYSVSPDKKEFTFELRKGVRFHDGSEMTAEDVKFSFDVLDSGMYQTAAESVNKKEWLEKIEILDKYKIRFTTKSSIFVNLDYIAGQYILPKAVYGDKARVSQLNKTVIATGPYKIKEYKINGKFVLAANPDWWGRNLPKYRNKYNFSEIAVRYVNDQQAMVEMLETGALDYTGISLDTYLKRTKGEKWGKKVFAVKAEPQTVGTTQTSLFWNLRLPLFQSKKVRRALQLLFNRQIVNEKMNGGLSSFAVGPWNNFSFYADPSVKPTGFNPEEAMRLLREDGWKDTNSDGLLDKQINGKRIDFKFTVAIPRRDLEKYFTIYQNDLKKAGIQMDLQFNEWNLFTKRLDELNYEAYVVGRGYPGWIDFNPKSMWHSTRIKPYEHNCIGYQNKEVDVLLEKAELEANRDERAKLLRQVYKIIAEDHSQLQLLNDNFALYARSARVKTERPNYRYAIGIDYWWIEE